MQPAGNLGGKGVAMWTAMSGKNGRASKECQWADIQWDRIAEIKSYYQYPCSFLLAARKSRDLPMAKANALISDPIRALCGNAVILRRIAVAGKAVGRLDHL